MRGSPNGRSRLRVPPAGLVRIPGTRSSACLALADGFGGWGLVGGGQQGRELVEGRRTGPWRSSSPDYAPRPPRSSPPVPARDHGGWAGGLRGFSLFAAPA